jgi:hypothetical protein
MKQKVFDALIKRRWGTSINPSSTKDTEDSGNGDNEFDPYEDDDEKARIVPEIDTNDACSTKCLPTIGSYILRCHSKRERKCPSER